jgi:hypothetical protein
VEPEVSGGTASVEGAPLVFSIIPRPTRIDGTIPHAHDHYSPELTSAS